MVKSERMLLGKTGIVVLVSPKPSKASLYVTLFFKDFEIVPYTIELEQLIFITWVSNAVCKFPIPTSMPQLKVMKNTSAHMQIL